MKKLLRDSVILGIIGFISGLLVSFVIYYFTGAFNKVASEDLSTAHIAQGILVGGLQGALAMGTTVFYSIESWSILRATLTHFITTMAGFMIMAAVQGWLDFTDKLFVLILILMLIIYFMIWGLQYLSYLRTLRKMNEEIDRIKKT